MLFKRRLHIQDFAAALAEAHRTFFSEAALNRLTEKLHLMIASSNTSRAKLEWSMFGIYAIIKGVEGNVQDATLRHCATTAFLANMYAQVESEIGATQADSTELAVVTTERFREYDAAWHKFGDDRGAQELGEQVSKRVLEIGLRDNPLVLAFGQAAVINMIETARFIQKTLSIVKLKI